MDLSKLIVLASKIDKLDYYQVLGLKRDATLSEIRAAYHKRARTIHPDLFYDHPNEEFRFAIDKIFKRVAEAYTILRDEEKRKHYDRGLTGEKKKLRYTEEDDRALRQAKKARMGKTRQGRQLYEEAQQLYQQKEIKKAIQKLRMALVFEQDNEHFQELLAQWQEELG